MKIYTTATFKILALRDGKYEGLTKKEVSDLCVGGFTFLINGKEVPFDFDAHVCNEDKGIFTYESGYGFVFNDFEPSDCYDSDLEEIGLSRAHLTPFFLSHVSEIKEFHLNFLMKKNGKEEEIDIGDSEENIIPDTPFKIELLDIYFKGENDDTEYRVNKKVVQKFNGEEDPFDKLVRTARELAENTPNGCVQDADTILHDILSEADFEITGIGSELFNLFYDASEEEKEMFKKMFYVFTDTTFEEYVERCIERTTK